MLASLREKLRRSGTRFLVGEYLPTVKNKMCEKVLEEHGFIPLSPESFGRLHLQDFDVTRDSKGMKYLLDLENAVIPRTEVFLGN